MIRGKDHESFGLDIAFYLFIRPKSHLDAGSHSSHYIPIVTEGERESRQFGAFNMVDRLAGNPCNARGFNLRMPFF